LNKVIISEKKEKDSKKESSFSALRRANILAENMFEEELGHSGVKGMKWGVRNERESSSNRTFSKKEERSLNRAANKGMRIANRNYTKVYNKMADESAGLYKKINGYFEKKYGDQFNPGKYPDSKITKSYWNAASKAVEKSLQMHSNNILGSKIDSRLKVTWFVDLAQGLPSFYIELADAAKHSEEENKIQLIITFDSKGKILKYDFPEYLFEEESEGELAHYGVLGMKWGIRNARGNMENSIRQKYGPKAADRFNQTMKKRDSQKKAIAKNKSIISERKKIVKNRRTMSDEQIKKMVDRMQLEKKLSDLGSNDIARNSVVVATFVAGILGATAGSIGGALGKTIASYLGLKVGGG